MRVLAIESSCDESAAAVLDAQAGLLAHELFSQVELHRAHGGVVPELASRDHVRRLLPLVERALERADTTPRDLHGVAYTAGPGLIGALLTGAALARSLAYAWGLPAIGVHHLEGHLLAPLLEPEPPPFPHLALLVSGGHTLLIEVARIGSYRVLGASRDDAAGEAFDKTAKLLGLPYPGGPQLAQIAAGGKAGVFSFPRALEYTGLRVLVVSGGVSANRLLRERLSEAAGSIGTRVYYPRIEFSTDNAAMIALAGLKRLEAGQHDDLAIQARAQWPLESLPAVAT